MSTSVLVRGTLHQRHSRVPTNDATSSHRLHSLERESAYYAIPTVRLNYANCVVKMVMGQEFSKSEVLSVIQCAILGVVSTFFQEFWTTLTTILIKIRLAVVQLTQQFLRYKPWISIWSGQSIRLEYGHAARPCHYFHRQQNSGGAKTGFDGTQCGLNYRKCQLLAKNLLNVLARSCAGLANA